MSTQRTSADDRHEPGHYEIRLKGHIENRWAAWFCGLSLIHQSDGTTILYGPVVTHAEENRRWLSPFGPPDQQPKSLNAAVWRPGITPSNPLRPL